MKTKISFLFFIIFLFAISISAQVFEWVQYEDKDLGFKVTVPEGNMREIKDTITLDSFDYLRNVYTSRFPTFNGDMEITALVLTYPDTIDPNDVFVLWDETIQGTIGDNTLMYRSDYAVLDYVGKMWRIDLTETETREDYRGIIKNNRMYLFKVRGPITHEGEVDWRKRFFNSIIIE